MPNFVFETVALAFPKTDLAAVPVGGDATKYLTAAQWNTLCQAAMDLRGAVLDVVADVAALPDPPAVQPRLAVVAAASAATNPSVTPMVAGGLAFDPSDYVLAGTDRVMAFRAVLAVGNVSVIGHAKLRNVTDAVDVCTLTFSGSTAPQILEQALTIGAGANQLPDSEKLYEVTIYTDVAVALDDLVTLHGAELRIANVVI
jgi:hypothetical protein